MTLRLFRLQLFYHLPIKFRFDLNQLIMLSCFDSMWLFSPLFDYSVFFVAHVSICRWAVYNRYYIWWCGLSRHVKASEHFNKKSNGMHGCGLYTYKFRCVCCYHTHWIVASYSGYSSYLDIFLCSVRIKFH